MPVMRATRFASLVVCCLASGRPPPEITLYVRNQNTPLDNALLSELKRVVSEAGWSHTSVVSASEAEADAGYNGFWSLKPWITHIERKASKSRKRSVGGGQRWAVFLEPGTAVHPQRLEHELSQWDARETWLLGHKLKDAEPSIIHHYNNDLEYPFSHAGFAISAGLLKKFLKDAEDHGSSGGQQIEPLFELAVWAEKLKVKILDRSHVFCAKKGDQCGTWATMRDRFRQPQGLTPNDVVIAVKTVEKFHEERLPILHEVWGKESPAEVLYLSNAPYTVAAGVDVVDLSPEFGDAVDPAKEATKQGSGHCSKMQAMLKHLAKSRPGKSWYVVTDDDTLMNVPRLLQVLGSHDASKKVYMGERYGWAHGDRKHGTDYVTTGGGMALSGAALEAYTECAAKRDCRCGQANSPDDMALGNWMRNLQIPVVHEEGFKQSEPKNFHPVLLSRADPHVSFHRFDVYLSSRASLEEKLGARRQNWKAWVTEHFKRTPADAALGTAFREKKEL